MNFISKNCKGFHLGYLNEIFNHDMNGYWLESLEQGKDLCVIISRNLKVGNLFGSKE